MTLEQIPIWIVIGDTAGLHAKLLIGGVRLGLIGTIVVGVLGGLLGDWLFGLLGLRSTKKGAHSALPHSTISRPIQACPSRAYRLTQRARRLSRDRELSVLRSCSA